jgi:hypothetical protein
MGSNLTGSPELGPQVAEYHSMQIKRVLTAFGTAGALLVSCSQLQAASALPGAFRPLDTVLSISVGAAAKPSCTYVRRRNGDAAYKLCLAFWPDAYTGRLPVAELFLNKISGHENVNNDLGPPDARGLQPWIFLADNPYKDWRTAPTVELGAVRFRIADVSLARARQFEGYPYERLNFRRLSVQVIVQ